jgi:hypothetical protein
MQYVEARLIRICGLAGVSDMTVTEDNYKAVKKGLKDNLNKAEYNRSYGELRHLYFAKFLAPQIEAADNA